ncbi:SGNH/GDSL hydrolase family protein [Bradyrhizobium daqingense]|uniref:SGNH/GDSL hydrolase family protein n=1 Tax=Bradyrhizobium daqingense TaxID=993502 RepID=UPI00383478E3
MDCEEPKVPCELIKFEFPLQQLAVRLQRNSRPTIVAIGSSSTVGVGGHIPYPTTLEKLLREQLSSTSIRVINKGVSGQEAPDELARFGRDVFGEDPATVIWQVGTNAAWKGYDLNEVASAIERGVDKIRQQTTSDLILLDLQYAPALLRPEALISANTLVSRIERIARDYKVNVFRRFSLMWYLKEVLDIPFSQMISAEDPDQLHQSDWSYNVLSREMAASIIEALSL